MKISEVIGDTSSEDKALAGIEVQKANLKLRRVQKKNLRKPPKRRDPSRPTGSIPPRPPFGPIS